jgi:hypothetical protein
MCIVVALAIAVNCAATYRYHSLLLLLLLYHLVALQHSFSLFRVVTAASPNVAQVKNLL